MPKLSVGVIGTGSIGNVHLTGYASDTRNVQITTLCDVNATRLKEMGDKFGVPAERQYRDYNKMLASGGIDAVSVCLPNYLHYEAAVAVLKSGCDLLLEKPMVLTMAEAKALKKHATASDSKLMIAFSHRFMGANIAAKKLLDKGAIGKPFMIRVRYAHSGPYPGWAQSDWFYKKNKAGGGAMLDMGIHAMDICQYFIGEISTIQAEVRTLRKNIQVDDNAVMILDFGAEAKCLGYIECGWTTMAGWAGIEIFGDKGCIRLDLGKPGKLIRGITKPDGTMDMREEEFATDVKLNHWQLQIDQFIKFCLDKKTVTGIPGYDEGLSSLAVALAANESSKVGRRIKIKRS